MNSFLSRKELYDIGFKSIGHNVLISRKASIFGASDIEIGNNVRIDDFCLLSGIIKLGSYIHISAYTAIYGKFGVILDDFTGLSPRCTIFSATDDFSGQYMIGPMVNEEHSKVQGGEVIVKKYSQIGAGTIILPEVTIEEGVAVGSMSLINKSLPKWTICYGTPAKPVKSRSKNILDLAKRHYDSK